MSIRVAGGVLGSGAGETVIPDDTVIVLNSTSFNGSAGEWATPGVNDPRTAWTILTSGTTPTGSTGADGGADPTTRAVDLTRGFAYTESSEPVAQAGPWSLESPAITAANGTLTLTFDLHMRFDNGLINDGALLVQGWDGSAWVNIGDPIVGSQQDARDEAWLSSEDFGTYDSTGFSNADFRFRFLASRGQSSLQFNYDFCIANAIIRGPAQSRPARTDFDFDTGLRRLHVSQNAADPLDGQTPDFKFSTIQEALDVAEPGDVITIADGRYFEALTLNDFQGTPALPLWIAAETRGGVQISNLVEAALDGSIAWQSEGNGVYSRAKSSPPFAMWSGEDALPQWRSRADLEAITFQADANTATGAASTSYNKVTRGFAFEDGRVYIRLDGDQNPNGEEVSFPNTSGVVLLRISSSPYVIVDGLTFEASGYEPAVDVANAASIVTTVRNCTFHGCRHGVRCGADFTLIRFCEYRAVPGLEELGKDLRDLNTADSAVHERYHVDYLHSLALGVSADRFAPVFDGSIDIPSAPARQFTVVTKCLFTDSFSVTRIAQHSSPEFSDNFCIGIVGPVINTKALTNGISGDLQVFRNQFEDCQLPFLHTGNSLHARHAIFRNLIINSDFTLARPPFLISVEGLAVGASIHYYHNTIVNRITDAESYGAFGSDHAVWGGSQVARILTWQNNIVIMLDLDEAASDPASAGRATNAVVSPEDNAVSQVIQGTGGVYAGPDEEDMNLDPEFVPDDGTRGGTGGSTTDQTEEGDEELSFESFADAGTLGEWSSPGSDDPAPGTWTRTDAASPTGSTGAAGGAAAITLVPTAGQGYALMETSPDDGPATFSLESPLLDASLGIFSLNFRYHMRFGNGTLTDGSLQVQGWDGSAWSTIGSTITGSQQTNDTDPYLKSEDLEIYNSSGFDNDDFRFRLLGTRGAGDETFPNFNYDISVDTLSIFGPAGGLLELPDPDAGGGDGGGGSGPAVGIIQEFSGADGVDGWPGGLNFSDPEQGHSRANVTGGLILAGTRSLQTEVRTNDPKAFVDRNVSSPKRRNEYTWRFVRFPGNQVGYFGFYCRLPSSPMGNIRGCSIAQLHNNPESGELLQVSLYQGQMQFVGDGPSTNFVYGQISLANFNGTGLLDRRFKITCQFMPSTGGNGFLNIFVDGVQVVNYSGRTKPSGSLGPYFKHGLYHWGYGTPASNTTSIAVHDNLRIGNSSSSIADVDPDNFPRPGT